MSLSVVGAGLGRTGTSSLKLALERLGFDRCYHMTEVHLHPEHQDEWSRAARGEAVDWDALFTGYAAAVDWPACDRWRELAAFYPSAKVVLSLRDPERWYESVMNTIYPATIAGAQSDNEVLRNFGVWANELIWQRVFDMRLDDRAHAIDVYERHNAAVQAEVPAERLLVFEASQGWPPLCAFLGVDVPDEPYPRTNTTEDFRANLAKLGDA